MTYVDTSIATTPFLLKGDAAATSRPAPVDTGNPELAPLLSVLFLMIDESQSMVVNVTSAHPGAGTTTVARSVAAAAAATGWCRVALLDARTRVGRADDERGLIDDFERGESPALRSINLGAIEVDTGPLTTSGRTVSRLDSVRKLYGTLRQRYSLIVVDSPAVFAGQQTLTLAAAADETVLVVEAERTALADVSRARTALERRGASVLGMVMNKSRSRIPALFGRLA